MKRSYKLFIAVFYVLSVFLRLYPRISIDPHLLTFQGDIWYRLAMAQYILDNGMLPNPDLRYITYGEVPMWYPPLSPAIYAGLAFLSGLDLPTVTSRLMPFIEAVSPLSIFFLARRLYGETAAYISTAALALTPTFVFWTAIGDPQSLTLFMIPLYLLLWIKHAETPESKNIILLGAALAVNFLVHLSYFVAVFVILSATIALVSGKRAGRRLYKDFFKAVMISQLLTMPWWLSDNLYWWWIKALVTSSGLYPAVWQIGDYGVVAFILGLTAFGYLVISSALGRHRTGCANGGWTLLLLLWAVPLFIESQNEAILFAINRVDLTWTTLAKPLEGFRFFPYLAQPVSIVIGALFYDIGVKTSKRGISERHFQAVVLLLVTTTMMWGILYPYKLETKLQTSGLIPGEYEAAVWFRENAKTDSRIAADYYRAQMFSGVTGGKALDGGMFPLRNVGLPYISVPARVQDDLYILYTTQNPQKAAEIAKKYGVTHVFYSKNMEMYGNLLSNYRSAQNYGVPLNLTKFRDEKFFKTAYEDSLNDIGIFEIIWDS